ncbi:MAG: ABC transporter permease [Planctomycetes bacterium]|nr:ABC transporter permease [Planctomycetota bacterium]
MYKAILAIRYLFKRRISHFSLVAVALCVFVVLVVMTVLSGLTSQFKNNAHLSVGDCIISTKSLVGFAYYEQFLEILDNEKIVEAASPVIKNYAIVKSVTTSSAVPYIERTLKIAGIDPVSHSRVTGFADWLHYNKTDTAKAFEPVYDTNLPGCVMGVGFLFDRDSDGNYLIPEQIPQFEIDVTSFPLTAKGALAKAGTGVVNTKTFAFTDCAQSRISADWQTIYLPFKEAQLLCGMAGAEKRVNAIHIKFKPGVDLPTGCETINALWQNFVTKKAEAAHANLLRKVKVQNWKIYSREMVAVAETQQTMMIFCFAMIGIITVFIVFVVFYMIVCHKTKDIGILKSIGVSNANIKALFLSFAFLVAACGSVIGTLAGWKFLVHINQIEDWLFEHFGFQLFDRTMYAIGDIPNTIDLKVLAGIISVAFLACLAGAFIPSRQAAKLEPVDTLQVNQL